MWVGKKSFMSAFYRQKLWVRGASFLNISAFFEFFHGYTWKASILKVSQFTKQDRSFKK